MELIVALTILTGLVITTVSSTPVRKTVTERDVLLIKKNKDLTVKDFLSHNQQQALEIYRQMKAVEEGQKKPSKKAAEAPAEEMVSAPAVPIVAPVSIAKEDFVDIPAYEATDNVIELKGWRREYQKAQREILKSVEKEVNVASESDMFGLDDPSLAALLEDE